MNWSEMSPRERDALVAEHVMGWARCDDAHCDGCESPIMTVAPGEVYIRHPETQALGCSPSTDIAAAWEVVEKLRSEGWRMRLQNDAQHPEYEWRADFHDNDRPFVRDGHHVAGGSSAPEAICRCALRAMGIDV